jgi:hypothetical protein
MKNESENDLIDRLIVEAGNNNEYDNRDRLETARKAVKKRFADLRKELTELKRKLKTEEDFTASYIRRLHESEKKREEWQAIAENTMDASSEGAWMARALDAERGLAGLCEFVSDEADNDCHYGDNCPSNAGTRHGTCRSCKARQVLSACGIHVWFERDNLEACRNCGVVRRADDGNKPCKGEVKVDSVMGYLGRSMFQVEPMPKGAEPIYDKDLDAKGGSDS